RAEAVVDLRLFGIKFQTKFKSSLSLRESPQTQVGISQVMPDSRSQSINRSGLLQNGYSFLQFPDHGKGCSKVKKYFTILRMKSGSLAKVMQRFLKPAQPCISSTHIIVDFTDLGIDYSCPAV